jgi:hypothetical protein
MSHVIIPVLLAVLLGPGIGQLYNREFKKGAFLLVVSMGLLIAFSVWFGRAAMVYLPTDITRVDSAVLKNIIQTHIIPEHTGTFYAYQLLLGGMWIYGIVDAYIGGMRRRARITADASTEI